MKLQDRQIEVFQVVMECKTLTAAAVRLYVSQPSVSRTLARFEQVAGFKAFELKRGRLYPTEAAKLFYREVVKVRKGRDYLNDVAKEISNCRRGYISVGVYPSLSRSWIVNALSDFSNLFPGIQLSIIQKSSKEILEAVAMQRIDLGISIFSADSDELISRPIYTDEDVCILPTGHRLCDKERIKPSDFRNENFIGQLNSERNLIVSHENLLFGNLASINLNVSSASMACYMVAQGHGISVTSAVVAEEHNYLDIEARPLEPAKKTEAYILKSSERDEYPLIDTLEGMIHSRFN